MLWVIDRFGWEAAHTAPRREIKQMIYSENIWNAYQERRESQQKDGGWAKWETDNPIKARHLHDAMILARDDGSEG